jgi:hypothetical protein
LAVEAQTSDLPNFLLGVYLKKISIQEEIMSLRLLVLLFLLLAARSGSAEEFKNLKRLDVPKLSDFDDQRFDCRKSEVLAWVQDIEAVLATETYDFSVRCEITEEIINSRDQLVLFAWSHSFRQAKHPASDSLRLISVRQNLLDNSAIATNNGIAFDKRSHLDILRTGQRCVSTRVTAFETHVSEQDGEEYDWKDQVAELELMDIFDPCAASTVSSRQTSDGYAMDFANHNFRNHSIRSVIKQGDYVHVLLRFKGGNQLCQIATFQDTVPVQVCGLEWADNDEANAKIVYVTRSEWLLPNGVKKKLPVKIHAVSNTYGAPCEMIASVEWKFGNDVDVKLFDRGTLGLRNPAPKSDFGIPLLLR